MRCGNHQLQRRTSSSSSETYHISLNSMTKKKLLFSCSKFFFCSLPRTDKRRCIPYRSVHGKKIQRLPPMARTELHHRAKLHTPYTDSLILGIFIISHANFILYIFPYFFASFLYLGDVMLVMFCENMQDSWWRSWASGE